MPKAYWDEAFISAVFLINRMPNAVLGGQVPFEVLYKFAVDYSLLKVFGNLCYPPLRPINKHKLE